MNTPFLKKLLGFEKDERYVGIDIGTQSIKVAEVEPYGAGHRIRAIGVGVTPPSSFQGNAIVRPDAVGQAIAKLVKEKKIRATKAVVAVPGPAVFLKKMTLPFTNLKTFQQNFKNEAASHIPHGVDAVELDYQIIRRISDTSVEVQIVAAKKEVINGLRQSIENAGLIPAVADIDVFALGNMYESAYTDHSTKMVALLDVGAKFTSVNIIDRGRSIFCGDISVGGKGVSDALKDALGLEKGVAEKIKRGELPEGDGEIEAQEALEKVNEQVAGELARQLGFFWNSCAVERPIEQIYLSGGASQIPGLIEALTEKTKVNCQFIDSLRGLHWEGVCDDETAQELSPLCAVSIGLALRKNGDKQHVLTAR